MMNSSDPEEKHMAKFKMVDRTHKMPRGNGVKVKESFETISTESTGKWDISRKAAGEITIMCRKLDATAAYMDSVWKKLLGASVEYGEDLGIYRDVLEEELKVMDILNKECRVSIDQLRGRLEKYANLILQECKGQ